MLTRTLRRTALALGAALAAGPLPALAHEGQPLAPHDLGGAWSGAIWLWTGLGATAVVYWRGRRRLAQRGAGMGQAGRAAAMSGGLAVLALALLSPLDALAGALLSAHMLQHMLLMLAAAPLLAWAAPMGPLLLGLPGRAGHSLGAAWGRARRLRRAWKALTHPGTAWGAQALALWAWHTPGLYQAAIAHPALHALEHATFLGTSLLFWWVLLRPNAALTAGTRGPGAALYVFTQAVQSGLLGALMTFAPSAWYAAYAGSAPDWGLTALEDQQLAGSLMWIGAGVFYTLAALGLLARWFQAMEQRAVEV